MKNLSLVLVSLLLFGTTQTTLAQKLSRTTNDQPIRVVDKVDFSKKPTTEKTTHTPKERRRDALQKSRSFNEKARQNRNPRASAPRAEKVVIDRNGKKKYIGKDPRITGSKSCWDKDIKEENTRTRHPDNTRPRQTRTTRDTRDRTTRTTTPTPVNRDKVNKAQRTNEQLRRKRLGRKHTTTTPKKETTKKVIDKKQNSGRFKQVAKPIRKALQKMNIDMK